MLKQFSKVLSVVLTMAVIMTAFAFVQPVSAEDIPDMEKANVMWDLQNNTQLKYKQFWYTMGAKTHTVKMTNYQVTDADTPGYKKCSFKLTWNLKVKPTKKQINKMGALAERGKLYTEWGFCVVDYQIHTRQSYYFVQLSATFIYFSPFRHECTYLVVRLLNFLRQNSTHYRHFIVRNVW